MRNVLTLDYVSELVHHSFSYEMLLASLLNGAKNFVSLSFEVSLVLANLHPTLLPNVESVGVRKPFDRGGKLLWHPEKL